MQEKIKHLKEMKILPSDLSSGGSLKSGQDFNVESEIEFGLLGDKPNMGSWTLPPSHLSRVRSGR